MRETESGGNLSVHGDACWMRETEFGDNLSVHEADLESHVLNFVDDGYENVNLGSGPMKVCLKEIFLKTLSHESKVATFEFQAHPLFDLIVRLVCNLAVLVALQVQAFKVGAKAHKVSGAHAPSPLNEEEEDEREEERAEDGIEKDMLLLSKVPSCFQQKAFPVFVEGVGSTFVCCHDFSSSRV